MATSKAPFKVGDVVEVIPEWALPLLVIGKAYTVLEVYEGIVKNEWMVRVDDDLHSCMYSYRFKLADEFEGNV